MQLHYLSIFFCDVGTLPIPNIPTLMTRKTNFGDKKAIHRLSFGKAINPIQIIPLFLSVDNRLKIKSTVLVGFFRKAI